MSVTLTKRTATFRTSNVRHGASTRQALAALDGQRVTVSTERHLLLGFVRVSALGRQWNVLQSELSDHS